MHQPLWQLDVAQQHQPLRQAQQLDLHGHAVNQPDGTVEVLVEGEEGAVRELAAWLEQGPEQAQVSGVELAMSPLKMRMGIFGTKVEPMTCSNPQAIELVLVKLKIVWSNILQ